MCPRPAFLLILVFLAVSWAEGSCVTKSEDGSLSRRSDPAGAYHQPDIPDYNQRISKDGAYMSKYARPSYASQVARENQYYYDFIDNISKKKGSESPGLATVAQRSGRPFGYEILTRRDDFTDQPTGSQYNDSNTALFQYSNSKAGVHQVNLRQGLGHQQAPTETQFERTSHMGGYQRENFPEGERLGEGFSGYHQGEDHDFQGGASRPEANPYQLTGLQPESTGQRSPSQPQAYQQPTSPFPTHQQTTPQAPTYQVEQPNTHYQQIKSKRAYSHQYSPEQ